MRATTELEQMGSIKSIISQYGFGTLLLVIGIGLIAIAGSTGQNSLVMIGSFALIICATLVLLNNAKLIPVRITMIFTLIVFAGAVAFAWMDYQSVQEKLEFIAEQKRREARIVQRLKDIRKAEVSYKEVHGSYTGSFDELIRHVKEDSMSVVKAIGFVPDTLTEIQAVEMGIVTRDTLLISVRDTLFPKNYPVDSLRYVPFSNGKEFRLEAGEVERNQLKVKVFEAFASNDKILQGMNLTEHYIDVTEGLSVGSMIDPHTRGNWE